MSDFNSTALSLVPWLFAIVALVSAVLAIFQISRNNTAAAAVAAALSFTSVLLAYLPQIDSVQAFAVNVKMRQNLDRTEELLKKVRELSLVTATSGLYSVANLGRLGGNISPEKEALINEVLGQMRDAGLSKKDQGRAAQPWLRTVTFDLFAVGYSIVNSYMTTSHSFDAKGRDDLIKQLNDINNSVTPDNIENVDLPYQLDNALTRLLQVIPLQPDDTAKYKALQKRMVNLDREAVDNIIYPKDLDSLLAQFTGVNDLLALRKFKY